MPTRTVVTGDGNITLKHADLQKFRLYVRTKMDELEAEFLNQLPAAISRGKTPRQKQLLCRGFIRRVLYGHED